MIESGGFSDRRRISVAASTSKMFLFLSYFGLYLHLFLAARRGADSTFFISDDRSTREKLCSFLTRIKNNKKFLIKMKFIYCKMVPLSNYYHFFLVHSLATRCCESSPWRCPPSSRVPIYGAWSMEEKERSGDATFGALATPLWRPPTSGLFLALFPPTRRGQKKI